MVLKDLGPTGTTLQPSTDNLIWRMDWAANDTLPPGACSVTSTAQRTWSELPVSFTAQDQGESASLLMMVRYACLEACGKI